jgi:uncharacterized DUF497 family protein
MEFRWNEWNIEHVASHGVTPLDAEFIIEQARPPYPEMIGRGKWIAIGRRRDGAFAQVVFVLDEDRTIYAIHARLLDDAEKRRFRRRIR